MSDPARPRPALRCPICRRPAAAATRPFCSERCAQADLGRWLSESYAIPAGPAEETED